MGEEIKIVISAADLTEDAFDSLQKRTQAANKAINDLVGDRAKFQLKIDASKADEQLKGIVDSARKTSSQIRNASEDFSLFSSKMAAFTINIGGVALALEKARNTMSSLIKPSFEFNTQMEVTQVGIAGIITSMTTLNGKAIEYTQAMQISADVTKKLNDEALRTAASSEELTRAFQAILGPGLAAKMNIEQIIELTTTGVNAVKSLGLEQTQVVQELRDLVQGGIQPASSTLATALGITDSDIKAHKEKAGDLFNFLMERLSGFQESAEKFQDTLKGKVDQIKEGFAKSTAEGFRPLFDETKDELDKISKLFMDIDDKTKKITLNSNLIAGMQDFSQNVILAEKQLENLGSVIEPILVPPLRLGVQTMELLGKHINAVAIGIGSWYAISKVTALWQNLNREGSTTANVIKMAQMRMQLLGLQAQASMGKMTAAELEATIGARSLQTGIAAVGVELKALAFSSFWGILVAAIAWVAESAISAANRAKMAALEIKGKDANELAGDKISLKSKISGTGEALGRAKGNLENTKKKYGKDAYNQQGASEVYLAEQKVKQLQGQRDKYVNLYKMTSKELGDREKVSQPPKFDTGGLSIKFPGEAGGSKPKPTDSALQSVRKQEELFRAEQDLRKAKIEANSKITQQLLANENSKLENLYQENLIGYQKYYDEKNRIAVEGTQTELKQLKNELNGEKEVYSRMPQISGVEKNKHLTKVAGLKNQISLLELKLKGQLDTNNWDLAKAARDYADSIEDVRNQAAALNGDTLSGNLTSIERGSDRLLEKARANNDLEAESVISNIEQMQKTQAANDYNENKLDKDRSYHRSLLILTNATKNQLESFDRETLKEKITLLQEELKQENLASEEKRRIYGDLAKYKLELDRMPSTFDEAWSQGLKEARDNMETWGEGVRNIAKTTAESMERSMSDFFFDAMTGKLKSLSDYATSFLQSIARAMSDFYSQQLTQKIVNHWAGTSAIGVGTRFSSATILGGNPGIGSLPIGGGSGGTRFGGWKATGGPTEEGKSYIVGEEGPELINFNRPGFVYTASQTRNILKGKDEERDGVRDVHIHLHGVQDYNSFKQSKGQMTSGIIQAIQWGGRYR